MKQLLSVLTLCAFAFIYPLAGSAATTFLWNVVSPGANNWNVNANWTPSTGNPGATDTAIFGTTGTSGASTVVNNVVTVNTTVAALTFTNNTGGAWHVTQIPSGVTLTVTNFTAGGLVVDGITTSAAMVDGGTLLVTGNFTNANTGTAASSSSSTLDLSGLSNFVYSASAGTFNLGANGSRSIGNLTSAAASNSITAATILFETSASSSSVTGTWNLGAGTNRINANTINVGSQRSGGAVQFNTVSGGLRVRGTGGTYSDRANITLVNRNAGGTSGTSYGRLFLNDHPVDLKAGTLTVGQCSQATPVTGSALVELNAGILDATTINMAINSSSGTGNGTITVGTNSTLGTNGLLIIGGGGLSMANQTGSGVANGTNNINGGVVRCFGNIRKTTSSGTASITISSGGHLNMAALTNTIGSAAIPVDNLTLTDGTMTLPVFNANASATVNTLNIFGSADTINVSTVPGLGQFKLIAYTTLNGTFDFNLGSLPAGYQGYILSLTTRLQAHRPSV